MTNQKPDRDATIDRLLAGRATRSPDDAIDTTDACLDADTLAAWADDALDAGALAAAEAHAADCARCQAMLAAMARTTPLAPAQAVAPWWKPAFRWLVPLTALPPPCSSGQSFRNATDGSTCDRSARAPTRLRRRRSRRRRLRGTCGGRRRAARVGRHAHAAPRDADVGGGEGRSICLAVAPKREGGRREGGERQENSSGRSCSCRRVNANRQGTHGGRERSGRARGSRAADGEDVLVRRTRDSHRLFQSSEPVEDSSGRTGAALGGRRRDLADADDRCQRHAVGRLVALPIRVLARRAQGHRAADDRRPQLDTHSVS